MLAVYEFELFENEGFVLAFPFDMEGGTQGRDVKEASEMAADWLKGELEHRLMAGEPLPEATFGNEPQYGGRIAIVAVDANLDSVETVAASDAAEMLGVSRSRVSQMLANGLLEGYRKGRGTLVTLESVKARLAENPKAGRPRKVSA